MRNLKLDELFIGAWVKRLIPSSPAMFSEPLRVSGLFDDGRLYLDFDGNDGDCFDAELNDDSEALSKYCRLSLAT